MRIWQATGFTIGFAMAEVLSFNNRLWVLLSAAVLATLCSIIFEFTAQSKEELLPCVYHRQSRRSNGNKSEPGDMTNNDQKHNESGRNKPIDEDQHQNPIFNVYQGRRPSSMSNWSADSLDGANIGSTNINLDWGKEPQANRQNPSPVMNGG